MSDIDYCPACGRPEVETGVPCAFCDGKPWRKEKRKKNDCGYDKHEYILMYIKHGRGVRDGFLEMHLKCRLCGETSAYYAPHGGSV